MNRIATLAAMVMVACGGSAARVQRVAYPSGRPHFELELKNGVPEGTGRTWFESGGLRSEGTYVAGAKHGRFVFFTEAAGFDFQAEFRNDVEVWRSTDHDAEPPTEVLAVAAPTAPRRPGLPSTPPELIPKFTRDAIPAPYFTTLDRMTLSRVGVEGSAGSTDSRSFGDVTRLGVFGSYRFTSLGVYGRASQSILVLDGGMRLIGRESLELGGTYDHELRRSGTLMLRAGVLAPIGHDNNEGFLAGSFGSYQRVADAVESDSSRAAIRTSASFTRRQRLLVAQADLGVDWLLGGLDHSVDALLRANAGVGFGLRSAVLTFEVANTIRASDVSRRISSFGVGGTIWLDRLWLSATLSLSQHSSTALLGALGYEL